MRAQNIKKKHVKKSDVMEGVVHAVSNQIISDDISPRIESKLDHIR